MNEYKGYKEKLKEKYLNQGMNSFYYEYEKLEFLLTFVVQKKDVKPIAKELVEKFEVIEEIIKADIRDLKKISGIGDNAAIFFKVLGDLHKDLFKTRLSSNKITIKNKNDILSYLRNEIGFEDRENFYVIYLNSANQVLNEKELKPQCIFKGTLDRSAVYPREIITGIMEQRVRLKENVDEELKKILKKQSKSKKIENNELEMIEIYNSKITRLLEKIFKYKAKSVIFAHNHPSGKINPSKSDLELTRSMKNILESIDIKLLDHIIVTKDSHLSFLEEGLLE